MEAIKEALTFDDVLLLPRFSKILPSAPTMGGLQVDTWNIVGPAKYIRPHHYSLSPPAADCALTWLSFFPKSPILRGFV